MNRFLLALATFLVVGLTISTVTLATDDDPPPRPVAQPKVIQARPAQPQPAQPRPNPFAANRVALMEEEVELLEAHREVKKAVVRAAEVAVKGAEVGLDLVSKANVAQGELLRAKLEVETARAQLEIRLAEMKEVEVKIKHARKRLEAAKAAPPPPANQDPREDSAKVVEALKQKLAELEAVVADRLAAAAKAEAVAKDATVELDRVLDIAKRGIVRRGTIEAAEMKVKETREKADEAAAEVQKAQIEAAKVRAKLKEIEK